ncbi:OLC1v1016307C1 [Oldenlandia corymbosa var. corymbosa]|uniref:Aldehyde dehydrogenase n=1 Tax=Oldenlandia corymbosa var. corymbosa TaxID=529605 RepID=A0AAV1E7D8_OLDCO|nr:OLC1v1016307C1 [Oldenlandia corymbosa var. corymbosa]
MAAAACSFEATETMKELREAFESGKTRSVEWRRSQLKALLKMAEFHENDILDALRSDLSKPELESLLQEIGMMRASCKVALKELARWMAPEKVNTTMATFPSSGEIVPEPLGVVLVISAWNYPFMLSLDPLIGAIAAGNAVVLKPSEISPATSSVLAKLLGQYMDCSAVKVIEGGVPETTLLLEQKWDKIFYTGNGRVGRIVMAAAAKHLTPVVLELGGKSPVIVDSNTNLKVMEEITCIYFLKVTVRRIIAGKWGCNSGQACVSPDYVITTKKFAPELVHALKSELEIFYGKDPVTSVDLSRIVNSNHFQRLSKLLEEDKVSSKIVYGGQKDINNLKIAPTILLDVPDDSLIMNEEIFGPLLPIITVDKVEDSFKILKPKEKPLAAYLFTNDKKLKEDFISNVSAGGLVVNDTTMHLAEHSLPFGGVGESGIGAYHGKFSFDAFSHKKAVLLRSFAADLTARYPPYTPQKQKFLKALLSGSLLAILRALLGWDK